MSHTELQIDSGNPPKHVLRAGKLVRSNVDVDHVRVESAVDSRWFVVATGSTDDVSEEQFSDIVSSMRLVVGSEPDAIRDSYGVGPYKDQYMVRAEY